MNFSIALSFRHWRYRLARPGYHKTSTALNAGLNGWDE
jgi:hypothetical protein